MNDNKLGRKNQALKQLLMSELNTGSLKGRDHVRLSQYCENIAYRLDRARVSESTVKMFCLELGTMLVKETKGKDRGKHRLLKGDDLTTESASEWLTEGSVQLRDQVAHGCNNNNERLLDQTAEMLVENGQYPNVEEAQKFVVALKDRLLQQHDSDPALPGATG